MFGCINLLFVVLLPCIDLVLVILACLLWILCLLVDLVFCYLEFVATF